MRRRAERSMATRATTRLHAVHCSDSRWKAIDYRLHRLPIIGSHEPDSLRRFAKYFSAIGVPSVGMSSPTQVSGGPCRPALNPNTRGHRFTTFVSGSFQAEAPGMLRASVARRLVMATLCSTYKPHGLLRSNYVTRQESSTCSPLTSSSLRQ